jgi:hypothetical protein
MVGDHRERQSHGRNSDANRQEAHRSSIAGGMRTCRRRKPLDARMIGRQGVFQIEDGPKRTALGNLKTAGAQQAHNLSAGPMTSVREWQFKRKFRTNAYGWRASSLAISRLKEAAAEIRSVAKSDLVAAGDGVVSLMERIWPAFQGIDTSSGALGAAVFRTVNELIPILTVAPADHATRGKWLERLFEAVQNDGVEYLAPLEDRWGEIAQYPDLSTNMRTE